MTTVIIESKMSGTGSIYDLERQDCDREIKFNKNMRYAVVLPSYFGGKGHTCHSSKELAIKKLNSIDCDGKIIDDFGCIYDVNGEKLEIVTGKKYEAWNY